MPNNGLSGVITTCFSSAAGAFGAASFPNLTTVDLSGNALTGALSAGFGANWPKMRTLVLSNTQVGSARSRIR